MNKFTLNKIQLEKWLHNLLVFVSPVVILYAVAVVGIINAHNGLITAKDFIPNSFTLGGIVLYVFNAIIDYFRKLQK